MGLSVRAKEGKAVTSSKNGGQTDLLARATAFASRVHAGQTRKGTDIPYIHHPLEAARICATLTDDEEVLAAAVLHDVIEDAGVTREELECEFGSRVADLVAAESEEKRPGRPAAETWRVRKEETIAHVRSATDPAVKLLCLGDKLSNMRAMRRDHAELGDALWQRFNQHDPEQQGWYYRSLVAALEREFGASAAWQELKGHVEALFGK
jgi:myo-inositol-1(or 4)-monophosphatase